MIAEDAFLQHKKKEGHLESFQGAGASGDGGLEVVHAQVVVGLPEDVVLVPPSQIKLSSIFDIKMLHLFRQPR